MRSKCCPLAGSWRPGRIFYVADKQIKQPEFLKALCCFQTCQVMLALCSAWWGHTWTSVHGKILIWRTTKKRQGIEASLLWGKAECETVQPGEISGRISFVALLVLPKCHLAKAFVVSNERNALSLKLLPCLWERLIFLWDYKVVN